MKIAVLVKQVPETNSVKIDEKTGTVIRESADAIVNPLDLYAMEAALRLKEEFRAETTVFSMGPASAAAALREALAMGLDRAFLISDAAFAGSDTFATGSILSEAIRRTVPDFDLILSGERATDGDTGQVGPEIAAALDIPVVTYVSRIGELRANCLTLSRMVEGGTETVSAALPALITVTKSVADPRLPTLTGKIRARRANIPVLTQAELAVPADRIGRSGSPTSIAKIFRPQWTRQTVIYRLGKDFPPERAVGALVDFLKGKGL